MQVVSVEHYFHHDVTISLSYEIKYLLSVFWQLLT